MARSDALLEIEIIDPDREAVLASTDTGWIAYEPEPPPPPLWEPLQRVHNRWTRRLAPLQQRIRRATRATAALAHRGAAHGRQRRLDGNPRRDSRVRRPIDVSFGAAVSALPGQGPITRTPPGVLVLTSPFTPRADGGVRATARLEIPGSWPALPLWVSAEPWWREQTMLTVVLRSTRRWRYPRRYYRFAADGLGALTEQLIPPQAPRRR